MSAATHGLVGQLARFAAALRAQSLRVGLGDELDAATALTLVDLLDRAEVHRALRIAFKVPPETWEIYDRLFEEVWDGKPAPRPQPEHAAWPREQRASLQWQWDGQRVRLVAPDEERETPEGDTPSTSPEPMLRRKPFEQCSRSEIAALERLIARLAPRLAARRARRLVPTRGHGSVDLRRSFRLALKSDGDFLRLARRSRPIVEPRLVVLADTSGSMDAYQRMLLAFAFALRRTIPAAEIFAFNTALVRITRIVQPAQLQRTLRQLGTDVVDWSGGTRIGACVEDFNARYRDRLVNRHTTVMVFSDGLDHDDGAVLGRAMRALRDRAGRILWLNPLLGDPRYRPEADAMRAALPYIDHFRPAHNLESLESLLRFMA